MRLTHGEILKRITTEPFMLDLPGITPGELAGTVRWLLVQLRIAEGQVERYALCPDHRDKASGRCIVCQAEERTRANA